MYYIIYKIINNVNSKSYIGKHQTVNINDNYFGSGKLLKKAIKKYGKKAFTKQILFIYETETEMNKKEKDLVSKNYISRKDIYNIGIGGEGGPHFKGRKHSEETKKKISIKSKERPPINAETRQKISISNKNRIVSDITRKKISQARKGQHNTPDTEFKKGKKPIIYKRTKEIRDNLSIIMKEKYSKIYSKLIWVKNLKKGNCLRINEELLQDYINKGYVRGRILKNK